MNKLPNEVINKIMLFNSHPVADLIKEVVEGLRDELDYYNLDVHGYVNFNKWGLIELSFADLFFNVSDGLTNSDHIYFYESMDDIYVETLNEYLRNSRK